MSAHRLHYRQHIVSLWYPLKSHGFKSRPRRSPTQPLLCIRMHPSYGAPYPMEGTRFSVSTGRISLPALYIFNSTRLSRNFFACLSVNLRCLKSDKLIVKCIKESLAIPFFSFLIASKHKQQKTLYTYSSNQISTLSIHSNHIHIHHPYLQASANNFIQTSSIHIVYVHQHLRDPQIPSHTKPKKL